MQRSDAISFDRTTLVYQYHERLYRLALLLTFDADAAAKLVERAYRDLPPEPADAESQLIRTLLCRAQRPRRGARATGQRMAYAGLDPTRAAALLDTLATLPARARLAVGLHSMRGLGAAEIERLLAPGVRSRRVGRASQAEISIADTLTSFRISAARELDLVPEDVDDAALAQIDQSIDGQLPEAALVALRRAVFEDPAMRAARDGMAEARDLLARAIPSLFAAPPPASLTARLLKLTDRRQRTDVWRGMGWARAGLAVGVLALAAAIVLVPSWLSRPNRSASTRAPAPGELIEAAIHRFDQAPLQEGVLHEQYRVAQPGSDPYLIERWYDYAASHRLRIAVKTEGTQGAAGSTLMEIASDGRSLVQYRYAGKDRWSDGRPIDVHVSEDEAQAALALLRGEPSASPFARGRSGRVDVAPLYLAQARANGATFVGRTRALDRPAFLMTYRTDRLPDGSSRRSAPAQPSQVILTIDAQTYALLDIAVVADGAAESSALHPLQAQVFEVVPSASDDLWRLPTTGEVEQRAGLPSARAPEIPGTLAIGLDDALRRAPHAILAPQQLPSQPMRGLALPMSDRGAERVVLLYEGEFQSVLLSPIENRDFGARPGAEERSAGAFHYREVRLGERQGQAAAIVFRPEAPDQQMLVMLVDEYATDVERESALAQIIGSLTPVTEQNLPDLGRNFYQSPLAGGQG